MKRLTVRLPEEQLEELEELVDEGRYPNKSEAARDAIRKLLDETADDEQEQRRRGRQSSPKDWSRSD